MNLDLGPIVAVLNVLTALGVVGIAQSVTRDYSTHTEIGMVKLFHRLSFLTLAGALSWNAYRTLESDANPRVEDILVQLSLTAVVAVSFVRHMMVRRPPLPFNRDPHGDVR